jgi:ATP-dependent helicase/nuclease subunit A
MVRRSLEPGAEVITDPVSPEITILRRGRPRAHAGAATAVRGGAASRDLPSWLRAAILPEPGGAGRIRPSHALDPSLRQTQSGAALEKGRLLHALLQHLPDVHPQARAAAGERFLRAQALNMDARGRSGLVGQACAVLDHPACAALFMSGSLAEVEIAGTVPLPGQESIEVSGRIDRLLVNPDEVRFCDFKTGASPPALEATPRAHVTQAALYRAALAALYPDRPIRAFLIWTEGPQIVELPPAMLNEALAALAAAP